jgi:hypothetical protein
MKHLFHSFGGIVLVTAFLHSGAGQSNAQENDTAGAVPLVSPSALESVASPAKVGGGAMISGATSTNFSDSAAFPGKTALDDPGSHDPRLRVPVDEAGKVTAPKLSKIDLDADLDYDGTFDNTAPAGQGVHEFVPPGLELGVGELSRLLIRFKTYERDFPGTLVVGLEVTGVNREASSGVFEGGETAISGRLRVWRDAARTELLLDSGDPSKRRFEWTYDSAQRSGGIPRTIYVEGVEVSPQFEGDLRLLVVASHVPDGGNGSESSPLYQSAFDHLLITVRTEPIAKEFINNNVEKVWSMVDAPGASSADGATEKPSATPAPRE